MSEYRWNVFGGELVGGVRYEQTGLTDRTVANHHAFYRLIATTAAENKQDVKTS